MGDDGCFSVHDFWGVNNVCTVCGRNPLVTQADAEDWIPSVEIFNDVGADAEICAVCRVARAGRDDDVCWFYFLNV